MPALLAGNAVCYKPSEHATLTGLRLVDLLHRAGVPVDVVHAIVGGGPTGAALIEADVDLVCFTGSYATGREVARAAADRLVRVQLELGGKDAAYVCDDVDPEEAAFAVAEGAFYNGGQSCSATERVYVHEAVWEPFVAALVEWSRAYRVGDPADDATDVGPLARAEQLPLLEAQLADAVDKGGKVRCGGERHRPPGQLVRADGRRRRSRHRRAHARRELRSGDRRGTRPRRRRRDRSHGRHASSGSAPPCSHAIGPVPSASSAGSTSATPTGTRADRSCVRLPWAGRRHSGLGTSMSESGVRVFVREKAWHLRAVELRRARSGSFACFRSQVAMRVEVPGCDRFSCSARSAETRRVPIDAVMSDSQRFGGNEVQGSRAIA